MVRVVLAKGAELAQGYSVTNRAIPSISPNTIFPLYRWLSQMNSQSPPKGVTVPYTPLKAITVPGGVHGLPAFFQPTSQAVVPHNPTAVQPQVTSEHNRWDKKYGVTVPKTNKEVWLTDPVKPGMICYDMLFALLRTNWFIELLITFSAKKETLTTFNLQKKKS